MNEKNDTFRDFGKTNSLYPKLIDLDLALFEEDMERIGRRRIRAITLLTGLHKRKPTEAEIQAFLNANTDEENEEFKREDHPASAETQTRRRKRKVKYDNLDELLDEIKNEPTICQQADDIVNGRKEEKERQYGSFSDEAKKVIDSFNAMTGNNLETKDFFIFMTTLKLIRECHNHKRDNLLDAVAYLQGLDNFESK